MMFSKESRLSHSKSPIERRSYLTHIIINNDKPVYTNFTYIVFILVVVCLYKPFSISTTSTIPSTLQLFFCFGRGARAAFFSNTLCTKTGNVLIDAVFGIQQWNTATVAPHDNPVHPVWPIALGNAVYRGLSYPFRFFARADLVGCHKRRCIHAILKSRCVGVVYFPGRASRDIARLR